MIEAVLLPSLPTAMQVLVPVAQETAWTFGSGMNDAVVTHEGVVAKADGCWVDRSPSSPSAVDKAAAAILLTECTVTSSLENLRTTR
jgi:hypothetical protein